MDQKAARNRLHILEREAAQLRAELGLAAPGPEIGLSKREALLVEAERVAHLGSWTWDLRTGEIGWSDEFYRILGLAPNSIKPSSDAFFAAVHPDDRERVQATKREHFEYGTADPIECRFVRPSGEVRYVRMEAAFVEYAGQPRAHVVGTVLDVTERKALEVQLRHSQKMEAVGTLAGGVAHDFNNYLMVLGGHLDLLSARLSTDSEARRSVDAMESVYQRCVALTQQLLTLSRKRPPHLRGLKLPELVDALAPMLRSVLGATLTLRIELDWNAAAILADPGQVEQALVNLALNARDAMQAGGTLTIRVEEICLTTPKPSSPERFVRLSVGDTGSGIPEALRSRIFDPFFTTKPVGKGTGLGLSTVYGILQDAGGRIEIESEVGRGTTFHLYFRRADSIEAAGSPGDKPTPAHGGHRRILLVEDVDLVRELIANQLQVLGYEVLTADDGLAALEILKARAVDAVVSDVVMPRMGGVELAHELSKRVPPVPCLLITGYSADALVHPDSQSSMPVLRKPFTTPELATALERLLNVDS